MSKEDVAELKAFITERDTKMNERITNIDGQLTGMRTVVDSIRGGFRMIRNGVTNRVAVVGDDGFWIEPNNVNEEYILGRATNTRQIGERNSPGVDWFVKKYKSDVLDAAEWAVIKKATADTAAATAADGEKPEGE